MNRRGFLGVMLGAAAAAVARIYPTPEPPAVLPPEPVPVESPEMWFTCPGSEMTVAQVRKIMAARAARS